MEKLEETKNKIGDLLDWVSNIGKEKEMAKENGNVPVEGREDDPNGNALDTTDNTSKWPGEDTEGISKQYERLKVSREV